MRKMKAKIVKLYKETAQIEVQYESMDPVALNLPAKDMTAAEIRQLIADNMPHEKLVERAAVNKRKLDYAAVENLINKEIDIEKKGKADSIKLKPTNSVYVFS